MSIAEKLTQVAENVPKVYEAGKKAVYDELEYIDKTLKGKVVRADYVSEVPHDVVVHLTSDTITDFSNITVTRYRKNLIPFPYAGGMSKETNGVTFTVNEDHSIYVKGTAIAPAYFILQTGYDYGDSSIDAIDKQSATNGIYTLSKGLYYDRSNKTLSLNIKKGVTVDEIFYPQVELGSVATEYELYTEPLTVTANADGTVKGISSLTPTMSFISSADVYINISYRRSWGSKIQDDFWSSIKESINEKGYSYAFAGKTWNANTFKPTFDIAPTDSANNMFCASNISNIKQSLEDCEVKLDLSKATNCSNAFTTCATIALPEIDMRNATQHSNVFAYSSTLQSIDMVYFKEGLVVTDCFRNCTKLTHVIFGGTFSSTGLNLQWSTKLDKESITSIFNALSTTTSGLSVTLSKTAVNNAFGIDVSDETTFPEGSEYYKLRHSKDNWTVNYI
jgi:hypothetical protein